MIDEGFEMNAAAEIVPLGERRGRELQATGSELSCEIVNFAPKLERVCLHSASSTNWALEPLHHEPCTDKKEGDV